MATIRVSNIEAKADAGSPTIDEKVTVKNSLDDVLLIIDGKNASSGVTTIGVGIVTNVITVEDTGKVIFNGGSAGATGGATDRVFYENDQTVNFNYEITTNKNAMSAGPVTVSAGVTVTIPGNSYWTIV